jgi:glycosyltransferase involved in cell wall biosynthesis
MKVIILCSNYEPGGAQRAALRLLNEMNNKGIDARCWFMHRKSPDFTTEPDLLLDKKISSVGDVFGVISKLRIRLKEEKPDAVISFLPYANVIGQYIAKRSGVKIRISSHRNLSEKELGRVMKFLDLQWARKGIYTGITAVSKSTKNSFRYYGERVFNKIKVINNGITFKPAEISKEECRDNLGIKQGVFVLGNVGRLVEQKNQMLLIDILPQLPEIELVIVGKGELKDELLAKAAALGVTDRLTIIDELNATQIPQFLKAIDVFVMPSKFEGMSNALAEALYAGLPIVSSDVESQSDVLIRDSDGLQSGLMASNSSPEEWVKQLLDVYNSPQLRADLSEKALLRSKDFTIGHMTDGFIEALKA